MQLREERAKAGGVVTENDGGYKLNTFTCCPQGGCRTFSLIFLMSEAIKYFPLTQISDQWRGNFLSQF